MKRFIFKAYDATGGFISTISDVTDEPKFTSYINGGLGDLTFKLPRSVFQYEEGTVISQNNQIKIECFDKDAISGTTIYNGYISKYAPTLKDGKQYINVTCLGYVSEMARFMAEDASGNTTLTYNSYDPTNILKDILDKFTAAGGHADYTEASTIDTNTVVSYEFNTCMVKEVLDKIIELSPNGYYYFVDANNTVNFGSKDATANHTFVLGKDVISIIPEKSGENMVNRVYFTGGDVSGTTLYKKYERTSSISTYGLHAEKYIDSRVTNETTADIIAASILDKGDTPETRTTLVIRDNNGFNDGRGYDIESIKPGDTCKVIGYSDKSTNLWDIAVWDADKWDYDISQVSSTVQQIMKVSYEPNKVTLEISSKLPDISHRIEDIKRNLTNMQTDSNPSAPTT